MIFKYALPLLACAGFAFALWTMSMGAKPVAVAAPVAEPAEAPFQVTIAGAGIVEARTQNIAIGSTVAGVVVEVPVQVGQKLKKGAVLFRVDDRDRKAELAVRSAALDTARAELARLESLPRAEDLPPLEARVAAAETDLADAKRQLELAESLPDMRAVAVQEWDRRKFAVRAADARLATAKAELEKARAGAWAPEKAIASANVASAQAKFEAQVVELERLVVRAPVDATVLQINLRAGEFAPSGATTQPLLLLGDVDVLHVRVDIDENDAWRFRPGAKGVAYVRGNRELKADIEFVRVDPYVVPKRSLTGESTERVDTRVLQVLYRFDPAKLPVYAGQQMDVFLEVKP
ncbi:MAG: HlyD family efflux transporter periplasmic adaptor subunit [Planctomycetes bacterium]|nr:HlyD family efflux transporter periplasmic adaptor subunit [Planctomycetota bacterium]